MKNTEELLAYMDALSRAQAAGHKVDNELKEVIRKVRIETGVADYTEAFESAVKSRVEQEAGSLASAFLLTMKKDGLISFDEHNAAQDKLYELREQYWRR